MPIVLGHDGSRLRIENGRQRNGRRRVLGAVILDDSRSLVHAAVQRSFELHVAFIGQIHERQGRNRGGSPVFQHAHPLAFGTQGVDPAQTFVGRMQGPQCRPRGTLVLAHDEQDVVLQTHDVVVQSHFTPTLRQILAANQKVRPFVVPKFVPYFGEIWRGIDAKHRGQRIFKKVVRNWHGVKTNAHILLYGHLCGGSEHLKLSAPIMFVLTAQLQDEPPPPSMRNVTQGLAAGATP